MSHSNPHWCLIHKKSGSARGAQKWKHCSITAIFLASSLNTAIPLLHTSYYKFLVDRNIFDLNSSSTFSMQCQQACTDPRAVPLPQILIEHEAGDEKMTSRGLADCWEGGQDRKVGGWKAHLLHLLHTLDRLVHQLPVVLFWPVAFPLHLEGGILYK